jgi:hypothetical protein
MLTVKNICPRQNTFCGVGGLCVGCWLVWCLFVVGTDGGG